MRVLATVTNTQGIIAIAAAGVAAVALMGCAALALRMRRLRRAQQLVLGEHGERDVVAHAAGIEQAFDALRQGVQETAAHLDGRIAAAETALRGAISHSALVRYDAYNELSGHQSSSVALLDSRRSGVVVSSIVHRDQARIYLKRMTEGQAEIELSPEEQEAVNTALQQPTAQHAA